MPVDFRPTEAEFVSQAFDVAQDFQANELGTVATFRDVADTAYGSANFKYVKFSDVVTTPASGWACYYKAGGVPTSTVTATIAAGDTVLIGAGILHSVPTDGQYCWIQQTGYALLTLAISGSSPLGKPVTADGHSTAGGLAVTQLVAETRVGSCAFTTYGLLCAFH